ncbi:MAG: 5,10-methylenetetrahydrofolate reductase, partial [Calditrichaeota bacterium]
HKVDQGAHYIITQMFFDFQVYKNFVERAREIGITVPIIPGIKPLTTLEQLSFIPRYFHVNIPYPIVEAMENARTREQIRKVGLEKTAELCRQLIDYKVPGLHIYTMGRGSATRDLLKMLMG